MSTASLVKETWDLTGDDARRTLESTGRAALLKDAFVRLRAADGTSHARSLAFAISLVLVQGLVVVVGFAVAFGSYGVSNVIVDTVRASAPGHAGDLLTSAVEQANRVGRNNRFLPLIVGLVGTLITATIAMGQLERAMNRIYGIEKDRPLAEKYPRALGLAVSAGIVIASAFALLAFGRGLVNETGDLRSFWLVVRWPVGVALVGIGLAALFRWAPRRRQPGWTWLAFGAGVAVAMWTLCTVVLAFAFGLSTTFGRTYGPLAGIVALQLWTFFSALAILYGVAVAAQLEAVRAGVPAAQDLAKDKQTTVRAPVSSGRAFG
ncbi:MAG: YihY/virulence factor BrkB family protein [Gaiellaceae bacterium]